MGVFDFSSQDIIPTVFIGAIIGLVYFIFFQNRKKLPPGPYGLPFVGYIPFLTFKPYIKLCELKDKYGPIFSVRIGSRNVIVLSSYEYIKKAFTQDVFIGRPPDSPFELSKESEESGAINGLPWKEHRRFVLQTLRELGFNKDRTEAHIREEICELLETIYKQMYEPIEISKHLAPSMSNNIASLVFGKRRNYDDPQRIRLDRLLKTVGQKAGRASWQMFFPWIRRIFKFFGLNVGIAEALSEMRNYFRKEVEEHEKTIDPNNMRDFIDGYLLKIEKEKSNPNSAFKRPTMVDLIGALFGAGSDTVRVTLDWLLLISACWPNVQKRVQAEIDEVLGRDGLPSRVDEKRMPYTEAVISELLRWRPIIPINLLRYTLEDTYLGSYFIPKHSYISANLWSVLHDPQLWGDDADAFRPERFLSEDEKTCNKPEYFIPFSTGKRSCPGEQFALVEVFMYYTAILQKFHLSLPDGAVPNFEGILGLSLQAKPWKLCLKRR